MLTDADVRRIADGTGQAPREFVRFFGESELHMTKRHPFWIRFARRRAAMALRWGRDRCIFLGPGDECQVYTHRPLACREHPFSIKLSRTGAVEGIRISRIVDCPCELDGHLTRRQLAAVSRWNERESVAYQKRVRAWNRDPDAVRTRSGFMEYLGLDWNAAEKADTGVEAAAPNPFG